MHRKLLFEIHGNSRHRLLFCKYRSMILFQNSQKSTCACASFLIRFSLQAYSPITKGTLSHVFCCEFFSEQFFFIEHLRTVDFEFRLTDCKLLNIILMTSMVQIWDQDSVMWDLWTLEVKYRDPPLSLKCPSQSSKVGPGDILQSVRIGPI